MTHLLYVQVLLLWSQELLCGLPAKCRPRPQGNPHGICVLGQLPVVLASYQCCGLATGRQLLTAYTKVCMTIHKHVSRL